MLPPPINSLPPLLCRAPLEGVPGVLRRGEWGGVDKVGDVWPLPDGLKMKFGKALADCRCRTVRWAMLAVAAKF
jgi:hypothetical protein